jgi:hypothetical protein
MRSLINWTYLLTRAGMLLFPAEHAASHAFNPGALRYVPGKSTAIARSTSAAVFLEGADERGQ